MKKIVMVFVSLLYITLGTPTIPAKPGGLLQLDEQEWFGLTRDEKVMTVAGFILGLHMMDFYKSSLNGTEIEQLPLFDDVVNDVVEQVDFIYRYEKYRGMSLASVIFLKDALLEEIINGSKENGSKKNSDEELYKEFDRQFQNKENRI